MYVAPPLTARIFARYAPQISNINTHFFPAQPENGHHNATWPEEGLAVMLFDARFPVEASRIFDCVV